MAGHTEMGTCEELRFLTRAPTRIELLRTIQQRERCRRRELHDTFEVDRTTISRNLDALIERGWVQEEHRTYMLTAAGMAILRKFDPLEEVVTVTTRLKPLLKRLPHDALGFDLRHLLDAELTTASQHNPYAPVNQHTAALKGASEITLLLPVVAPEAIENAIQQARRTDVTQDIIVAATAADALKTDSSYSEFVNQAAAISNLRLFIYPDDVPFYLGWFDDMIQLGVEDESGNPTALIETESEPVRTWAKDTFETYRQEADRWV